MGICQSKDASRDADAPATISQHASKALNAVLSQPAHILDQVKNANQGIMSKFQDRAHHLQNVFTAPLDLPDFDYKAPSFPKTPEQEAFIQKALADNFVFSGLSDSELQIITDAHEPHTATKGETIIKEGDKGDFFYILQEGTVRFLKEGKEVGKASKGASFGELALLYSAPRAASVVAVTDCSLYRLDQTTFRTILQTHKISQESEKVELLKRIPLLQDMDPQDLLKLAAALKPKTYMKGAYLVKKGDTGDQMFLLKEGKVRVTDISVGSTKYEDMTLKAGEAFGERAIIRKEPRAANCIAQTDVKVLTIDADTFNTILGDYGELILRAGDKRRLAGIKIIKDTYLSSSDLSTLASFIQDKTYAKGTVVMKMGHETEAALYIVRSGKVTVKSPAASKDIIPGGYFGEDELMSDHVKQAYGQTSIVVGYTVTAVEDTTLGVLTLQDCRKVFDTKIMGHGQKLTESTKETNIPREKLKKHAILGAGTFGQVWLVSYTGSDGKPHPYAYKIQSKYDLIQNNQAKGVVNEKNIMAQLSHPFIIELVGSYQDKQRVYMLMGLVQGGELYSVMHTNRRDGVEEVDAKFYSAGVIEGLTHMHNRSIIYRDLKPENVLIDADGYPVIIDLGFAKKIKDKTYTFCGTPLYLPPEIIQNRGHDKGADHWSFGVMLYEMVYGDTPFYKKGMDQMALFKAIVRADHQHPHRVKTSDKVKDLIDSILVKDPRRRIGSLSGGSKDIYRHEWYSDIDWAKLRRKEIKAPWKPKIKNPLDSSNFEDWSHLKDKEKDVDPPLSAKDQKIFETF